MLIVKVKEGDNIDKALKQFKRKFNMTGVMRQLHERSQFIKPSIKRREEVKKAIYVQTLKDNEEKQI